jgi:hypothetical protein
VALTNSLSSSMLPAAPREPLELADIDATRYLHLMTAKRVIGRTWIIQGSIAARACRYRVSGTSAPGPLRMPGGRQALPDRFT